MHMARLYDPSKLPNQYALSALSEILQDKILSTKEQMIKSFKEEYSKDKEKYKTKLDAIDYYEKNTDRIKKVNIKETFGFYKQLKDGTEGKILMFPDIEQMHTDDRYVRPWVDYSCFDAEITYFLRETLSHLLCAMKTNEEGMIDMLQLYSKYWLPFGEVLTDMEREGFKVDVEYLKHIQMVAEKDKIEYESKFLEWVHKNQTDAQEFNPNSAH